MYSQTDRNDPYSRILFDKMRKVAERIEPSEALEGDNITVDTIVNVSDRIRHFFPRLPGRRAEETLLKSATGQGVPHWILWYATHQDATHDWRPRKYINVYTEETAPNTLDRAIREVMIQKWKGSVKKLKS